MDSKQIAEAMRLKLPVRYNGITYQQITEYILWYDAAGTRRTSVSLLDKNSHSITRAPADRVELVAQEGGTDEQYHQRDPARELADYFENNLKDLIEAGKVVVMK